MANALLSHAQYEVVCCENALDALEHIRRQFFDVVITDANMRPHSGFDLIRSLKLVPNYDLVPVAMLTGRREKKDVERALSVGAQEYFVKPLDPHHFLKKVGEMVTISEEHQRAARFAQIKMEEVATCQLPLVIIGLTEKGVLIDSDHSLHLGSTISLDCELFGRIGIPKTVFRVTSCSNGLVPGTFEIRASFEDLPEREMAKVRQYVQAQTLLKKRNQNVA